MIYFEKKNNVGVTLVSNIEDEKFLLGFEKKEIEFKDGFLVVYTKDPILVKRAKIFRIVRDICSTIFDSVFKEMENHFLNQIKAHSHTLKKIQAQLTQKIESIVESPMLTACKDYNEQKVLVCDKICANPDLAADTLIYLKKRISEIEAHISSFEILHMGEDLYLDFKPHNIRRVILNILAAFQDSMNLNIKFHFDDDFSERNKIRLDYKIINTVFYNFFDNSVKYCPPYSDVNIFFEINGNKFIITVEMKSLRIEKEELEEIFKLNYRGKNAKKEDGFGVGMYVVKKGLELNRCRICVDPDYSDMEVYKNQQYILNKFIISGMI